MPDRRGAVRTTAIPLSVFFKKETDMMKKRYIALLACMLLVSCTKTPEIAQTFTLSVTADKAAGTKALAIDGDGALKATWAKGETVQVYKGGMASLGTLTAQSSGKSTTLSGSVSGTFAVGNTLRLEFLNADHYTSQNGILHEGAGSLDKTCDYATAEVKILSIDGNTITTETASFTNRQAIVKFTLKHADNPLSASELSVTVTGASQSIKISVTPPSPASELYVAIPCFYDSTFSFSVDALSGETHYQKSLESQALENGKYYHYTLNL